MRFTGEVTGIPSSAAPAAGGAAGPWPPARRPWSPWAEVRADLRAAALTVSGLGLAGLPLGLLWWGLAPRAEFRITAEGPVPVGRPSAELLVAGDAVFALVLAGAGLLAGVAMWLLRRRRGVAAVVALALGMLAGAAVAWQLGQLLGPGPTEADLADVGARVTTGLTLGSLPALAVAPFAAVLGYLLPVLHAGSDDLGRPDPAVPASLDGGSPGGSFPPVVPEAPAPALAEAPPPGRPSP